MTLTAMEDVNELLLRLKGFQERGPTSSWSMEALVWRNDVEVFMDRFEPGSKDQQELYSALNPQFVRDEDDWDDFWGDYGTPLGKALALVAYRIKRGQAKLQNDVALTTVVPAGTPHSAYVQVRDIVESANRSLLIVDPYIDRGTLPVLSNVGNSVDVRLLGRLENLSRDFAAEAGKFVSQYGVRLQIRCGLKDVHDRFIVADGRVVVSGASFKDIGNKSSLLIELTDTKEPLLAQIEAWWDASEEYQIQSKGK